MNQSVPIRGTLPWQGVFNKILYGSAMIGGLVTLGMAFHIAIEVGARNLFNHPLPGTLEITQNWSMVLVVMLAMGYAEVAGEHISATIMTQTLSPTSKWLSDIMIRSVALLLVGSLTYYSVLSAKYALSVDQVALGSVTIPIWPVKIVMAIGFALFTMQLLISLITLIKNGRPGSSHV